MLTPVPFVVTTVSRLRDRPPRVSTLSFSPCRNPIYPASFRIGIGLCVLSHTHPLVWPYMRFLCVTSGVCRRLPSSCTSQCTTCLKLGLGPISPTTGLAPARTTHMSCARNNSLTFRLGVIFWALQSLNCAHNVFNKGLLYKLTHRHRLKAHVPLNEVASRGLKKV